MSFLDETGLSTLLSKIKAQLDEKVPTTRTVNGKALSGDVTLNASDVSARPDTWTPTASDIGAVPVHDLKTQNPDFNDLVVSGKATMYEVSVCEESDVSLYHRPVYNAGVLITNGIGSRSQLFIQSGGESMWRRWGTAAGVWYRWVMVYDDAHKPSASDVGARPDTWMPSSSDVGAVKCVKHANAVDFNTLYETGEVVIHYLAVGSNPNAPTTNAGCLISNGAGTKTQLFIPSGIAGMYRRVETGEWITVYSGANKPTAADVGLGNVNNTADANKSVKYAATAGSAPANGGNADTVDGSHGWQLQTLAANGAVHGPNDHVATLQWDGANFILKTSGGLPTWVNCSGYAASAGNANTVGGWGMNLDPHGWGIKPICAGTGDMVSGQTALSNGHIYLVYE